MTYTFHGSNHGSNSAMNRDDSTGVWTRVSARISGRRIIALGVWIPWKYIFNASLLHVAFKSEVRSFFESPYRSKENSRDRPAGGARVAPGLATWTCGPRTAGARPESDWGQTGQLGSWPTTLRLTAELVVAASRCKHETYTREKSIIVLIGGDPGGLPRGESFPASTEPGFGFWPHVSENTPLGSPSTGETY